MKASGQRVAEAEAVRSKPVDASTPVVVRRASPAAAPGRTSARPDHGKQNTQRAVAASRSAAAMKKAEPMNELTEPSPQSDDSEAPGQTTANTANQDTDTATADQEVGSSAGRPAERRHAPGGPVSIPRVPAKAEVFVEGDHVVYPTHGVGKVERIATEEIAGHKLELIHITFEENRMTLRVPVAKARSAGLRKLATRDMFDEALKVLRGKARIKRTMGSRRAQEYEAKINSGDPLAIAEVVRDLHRNAGQPDQSFSERQIYEAAMDRLAAELAALDKTDKMTASTKLTEFLKSIV
jgi:CarD family transcriptional regulator